MFIFRGLQIVSLVLLFCSNTFADTLKDAGEARRLTDRVMAKVGEGDIAAGLQLVKPVLVVPAPEFNSLLEQLKTRLPAMSKRFGKSIGYEFIREDKIGENLLRIVQIHRFENHAMRWSFYFYRGKNGWVLNTFKTDDDIKQLFPQ